MNETKEEIISAKYITAETDHMAYQPGMDNIGSEIQDEVIARMNANDADRYTDADVQRALNKDVLGPEDFAALLSPAAAPFLEQMAQRAAAAQLLLEGKTYAEIVEETGISSATLSRVSRALRHGTGAYARLLPKAEPRQTADAAQR